MSGIGVRFQSPEAAARAVASLGNVAAAFHWERGSLWVVPIPGKEALLRRCLREGEHIVLASFIK